MSQSEAEITPEVITEARRVYGAVLLRNNSGAGFLAKRKGIAATNWIRFGLGQISDKTPFKSSDYIGPTMVTITPEMVGKTIAVFSAVELKKPGWKFNLKDEDEVKQANFIHWIKNIGGFAGFASSVDDLKNIFLK